MLIAILTLLTFQHCLGTYSSKLHRIAVVTHPVISGFEKSSSDHSTAPEHWEG